MSTTDHPLGSTSGEPAEAETPAGPGGTTPADSGAPGAVAPAEADALARGLRYRTPIEIWKPPTDGLRGYLWVEIVDPLGVAPPNIIREEHPWLVRCHVWLYGDIWRCVCGRMCLDMCFELCERTKGEPDHVRLEDLIGKPMCKKFKGCKYYHPGRPGEQGWVHVEFERVVPAGKLKANPDGRPRVYRWTGTLSLANPCGEYEGVVGFQSGEMAVYGR